MDREPLRSSHSVEGRVPLLLREEVEKRLFSLEKNLLKKPEVARRYKEAMNANVEKGYKRKLESSEAEDGPSWYLPLFPVIREDRETTKVRIVFDSAVRCEDISLNDAMLTKPKLQRSKFLCWRRPFPLVFDSSTWFPFKSVCSIFYVNILYSCNVYSTAENSRSIMRPFSTTCSYL